jgi:DNA invertase Pin-like site-specific DNA recombinase
MILTTTIPPQEPDPEAARHHAVAYYRCGSDHEHSIREQRDQIRQWAEDRGLTIIREFVDRGRSGLPDEFRHAFNDLLRWILYRNDFRYVLCLEPTR